MFNLSYVVVAKARPIPDWAWVVLGAVVVMMLVNRRNREAQASVAQQAALSGELDAFGPSVRL